MLWGSKGAWASPDCFGRRLNSSRANMVKKDVVVFL
jgi:hypothetical protein